MSHHADQEREKRHREAGGVRLHCRIGKDAADALEVLCRMKRLEKRQVIERLLLEALPQEDPRVASAARAQREERLMNEFNVSRGEARRLIEEGAA